MSFSLHEKINNNLKTALKEGRSLEVQVLRGVNASIKNKEIEKRSGGGDSELSEEEVVEVLKKELKKRKEAVDLYKNGNRLELAEIEEKEAEIIEKYLPEQMSDEEIEKVVVGILSKLEDKNFGNVMKVVMAELKGKADGKRVTEIVKSKL